MSSAERTENAQARAALCHVLVTIAPTVFPLILLYGPSVDSPSGVSGSPSSSSSTKVPSDTTALIVGIGYGFIGVPLCFVQCFRLCEAIHQVFNQRDNDVSPCEAAFIWIVASVWITSYIVLWLACARYNEPLAWGAWGFYVYLYGLHRAFVGADTPSSTSSSSEPQRGTLREPLRSTGPLYERSVWLPVEDPRGNVLTLIRVDLAPVKRTEQ